MKNTRKKYRPEFKAKVALEVLKGEKTIAEIARQYENHPDQILQWKKLLAEQAAGIFENKHHRKPKDEKAIVDRLYRQIWQLKVEKVF